MGHHHFTHFSSFSVTRHPAAPAPSRLQTARTFDDILAMVPRRPVALSDHLSASNCAASRAGHSGAGDHAG